MNDSMSSVTSIIKLLINDDRLDLYEELDDNEKEIKNGIKSTINICKTMLNGIIELKEIFEELEDFNLFMMIPMINAYDLCIKSLAKIGKDSKETSGKISLALPSIDALEMIIKANEHAKEAGEEGYNVLRDGILKIYGATSQIVENDVFRKHVYDLKRYIESINSIKLNNLIKLKDFVDSMNELSQRLGNLDKLTDAVGNKLSAVLYELVVQLRLAEATIKNAHTLQDKRKKLMDASMQKIEKIMKHLKLRRKNKTIIISKKVISIMFQQIQLQQEQIILLQQVLHH